MFFKLALSNVKKSIRDYLVYFLTLTFGICVFYVFNSVESQQAMMRLTESQKEVMEVLTTMIGGVSVFASAFLAARLAGEKGLLHGLVLGMLYAVFYVAISVMLYANMRVALLVIRSVIFVICGVCGGVMGVNRDEKIRF